MTDIPELTRAELQELATELGQDLYRAQDRVAFVREMLEQQAGPVEPDRVRGWLDMPVCPRAESEQEQIRRLTRRAEKAEQQLAAERRGTEALLEGWGNEARPPHQQLARITLLIWDPHKTPAEVRDGVREIVGHPLMTRQQVKEFEAALKAEMERLGLAPIHEYLSTGCWHGDMRLPDGRTGHEYCRGETGACGAKTPGVCKFCAAPCQCLCHRADNPLTGINAADNAETTQEQR